MFLSLYGFLRSHWSALVLLLLGIYCFSLEVVGLDLSGIAGDLGDGRFNLYILEHGYRYIIGAVDSYWNAPFMVPEKSVITYSDNLLGTVPIYGFFRSLGFERFAAYQSWYIALAILNYLAAYICLVLLIKRSSSAALGAFVFAFSIALQSQMTHAQTFTRFAIPFIFFFLLQFLNTKKTQYLLWALLCWSYQTYCGIYLGFLCAIPMGLMLTIGIWKCKDDFLSRVKDLKWMLHLSYSILLPLLSLLPLLLPYLARSQASGYNAKSAIFQNIPTLSSYIFSHYGTNLWNGLSKNLVNAENWWDFQLFPGGIALISFMAVISMWLFNRKPLYTFTEKENRNINILCFTSIFTIIICTRFGPISLYSIIYNLPGFGAIRAVQRIINIELLFFAFAVALASHILFNRFRSNGQHVIFILLAVLLFFDNYVPNKHIYRSSVEAALERESQLIDKLPALSEDAVLAYEPDSLVDPYFL